MRNQWTVTATALADAKKAADAGDFDKAVAAAKEAEALAKASVFQANSEKEAWKAESFTERCSEGAEKSHDHPPPGFP